MDDKDWLDQRLGSGTYLPDEGFTARVVGRLPVKANRAAVLRRRILFVSAVVAVFLGVIQLVPLVRQIELLAGQSSITHVVNLGVGYLHQPVVLLATAAVFQLSALALLPLLRRWE